MNRRRLMLAASAFAAVLLAAIFAQNKKPEKLLVLEWAGKSSLERPPLAILIEFGLKDTAPIDWSGTASVNGAKIVHREGYRFRKKAGDELTDSGWKGSSHRGLRVPAQQPAIARLEGIATTGVVLHLADIGDAPTLNIELSGAEKIGSKLSLKEVLAGKSESIFNGRGVVRLISTALPIATGKTEDDFPAACYGPDGTLWVAWIGYHVKDESRRIEAPQLKEQPKDFKAYYTPEFGDQLFVKYYREGKWSEQIAVTGAHEDIVRCAIAHSKNEVIVGYSARRRGIPHICFRKLEVQQRLIVGKEQIDEHSQEPSINPSMTTINGGEVFAAFQQWSGDKDHPSWG